MISRVRVGYCSRFALRGRMTKVVRLFVPLDYSVARRREVGVTQTQRYHIVSLVFGGSHNAKGVNRRYVAN